MKGICVSFTDPDLFFDSPRDVAMTLPWQPIWGKIGKMTFINQLAFQNRFEYLNSDLQMLICNIFATFCGKFDNDQSTGILVQVLV